MHIGTVCFNKLCPFDSLQPLEVMSVKMSMSFSLSCYKGFNHMEEEEKQRVKSEMVVRQLFTFYAKNYVHNSLIKYGHMTSEGSTHISMLVHTPPT
jgi:hypothetical protein